MYYEVYVKIGPHHHHWQPYYKNRKHTFSHWEIIGKNIGNQEQKLFFGKRLL